MAGQALFEQIHAWVHLESTAECARNECERLSAAERRAAKGQAGRDTRKKLAEGVDRSGGTASAVRVPPSSASAYEQLLVLSVSLSLLYNIPSQEPS